PLANPDQADQAGGSAGYSQDQVHSHILAGSRQLSVEQPARSLTCFPRRVLAGTALTPDSLPNPGNVGCGTTSGLPECRRRIPGSSDALPRRVAYSGAAGGATPAVCAGGRG